VTLRRLAALVVTTFVGGSFLTASAAPISLPAGATLTGTLQSEINTKTAQDGQRFTVVTNAGSRIYGHLSEVARGNVGRKAHVKLNFDSVAFPDGSRSPVNASLSSVAQHKEINYTQAAGQVVGGMIVGNVLGKWVGTNVGGALGAAGGALLAANTATNIVIPAGAAVSLKLNAPLTNGHPQSR